MWARIHLIPALQAEEDRDQVRRYLADKAREKELLGSETKVYNSDRHVMNIVYWGNMQLTDLAQVCPANLRDHAGARDKVGDQDTSVKLTAKKYTHKYNNDRRGAPQHWLAIRNWNSTISILFSCCSAASLHQVLRSNQSRFLNVRILILLKLSFTFSLLCLVLYGQDRRRRSLTLIPAFCLIFSLSANLENGSVSLCGSGGF
jgi:hypothetical protein